MRNFSLVLILILSYQVVPQNKLQKPVSTNINNYNEHYNYIAINNVKMWIGKGDNYLEDIYLSFF